MLELSELLLAPSTSSVWILPLACLGDLGSLSSSLAEGGDHENAVRAVEVKYKQKVWKWSKGRQPDPREAAFLDA